MKKEKKVLIIVESPAKAHKIQDILGSNYIVKASFGHVADLLKGGKHGIGIDLDKGFKPRYGLIPEKVKLIDELMADAKQCDEIYLFSDADREGEAISYHLKSRLEDVGKPIKRGVFIEITKNAILKAMNNLRDVDMNLVRSQEARRVLDRLVGFKASPFLMNNFQPNLSAGRVQSVVTRMIIDREADIQAFIPENFWTIQASLTDGKIGFIAKYNKDRITNEKKALEITDGLKNSSKFIVSEVVAADKKEGPNEPLTTAAIQKMMSKNHSINASDTMNALQKIYELGLISYHRTDSKRISEDALSEVRDWLKDNNHNIPKKPNVFDNSNSAQDAHECIRPTDVALLPKENYMISNPVEKLAYEEVWKHFVASQMTPAVYSTLKIVIKSVDDPKLVLTATGKALKEKGYLEILGGGKEGKIELPNLQVGDELLLNGDKAVKCDKKQTQPLPRYSESKLIEELEKKNIGRPSTYADLVSKIETRNYVEKRGDIYYPTDLGKQITSALIEYFSFMDYDFSSKMEGKLDEIAAGKTTYEDVLNDFYPKFKLELDGAYVKMGGSLCEKCKSPMRKITSKSGEVFLGCSQFPNCKNTKNISV